MVRETTEEVVEVKKINLAIELDPDAPDGTCPIVARAHTDSVTCGEPVDQLRAFLGHGEVSICARHAQEFDAAPTIEAKSWGIKPPAPSP